MDRSLILKPERNTVVMDCRFFELCFNCGKHLAIGVESKAGFMTKCLNCGFEELIINDFNKLEKIKSTLETLSGEEALEKIKVILNEK